MAKGLKISDDLALPLSAVTATMIVYGGKGMGKTNLGAVMMEEFAAAGLRFSVIDPMGVWWGLRHSADGKDRGVECLVLGGAHGDIPIEPTGGAVVADLVADESVNVLIDISRKANGEMWSIGERIRFMRDYGKQLFKRQGSLIDGRRREPICQVVDEAARFVPQMIRAGQPEVAECAGIWAAIVEEGRNIGLGVVMLTQRSARLNKDVAELADLMLAFRTIGPNSIEAVTDWLGAHLPKQEVNKAAEQVRSLPVGSCLAVSPGWLSLEKVVAIRPRRTFDSSATPKPGESVKRVRGAGATPDLGKYAERMRETIERAKENSPTELKAKISALQEELAREVKKQTAAVDPKELKEARARIDVLERDLASAHSLRDEAIAGLKVDARDALETAFNAVDLAVARLQAQGFRAQHLPAPHPITRRDVEEVHKAIEHAYHKGRFLRVDATDIGLGEKPRLNGAALKIAGIAAGYAKRGEGISRKLLATLVGMKESGGGFGGRLSEARTAGAIRTADSMVYATPEGMARFGDAFKAPETAEEVLALWRPKLKGRALAMFDHLVELRGRFISRQQLADAVGMEMSGGGFGGRLSEVRSTGLLVEQDGQVAVNRDLLFMGGD